jgi:hypothetical protein
LKARRPKAEPDPLATLEGAASCLECGAIVRAWHYAGVECAVTDPGPHFLDAIEEAVGVAWELRQGYGIGGSFADHAQLCPPARERTEVLDAPGKTSGPRCGPRAARGPGLGSRGERRRVELTKPPAVAT